MSTAGWGFPVEAVGDAAAHPLAQSLRCLLRHPSDKLEESDSYDETTTVNRKVLLQLGSY